jgi:transcriptional regulator with XRE-family HTH domain
MNIANQILWDIFQNNNCTQTEFCKKLGYKGHTPNMSQWLSGNMDLSLDKLKGFCDKLNLTLKIELV